MLRRPCATTSGPKYVQEGRHGSRTSTGGESPGRGRWPCRRAPRSPHAGQRPPASKREMLWELVRLELACWPRGSMMCLLEGV
eukprot:scaffold133472_cov55-Phaeocystis_antarctica.AAC.1